MTALGWAVLVVALLGVVLAAAALERERTRSRRRWDRWSTWVDEAVSGRLPAPTFEETAESSVDARLRRFLGSSLDARRRLDEERDAIQSLIGTIAHQAKLPLSNIILYAELVGEAELSPETRRRTELVLDQAMKLDTLVSTLVTASFLESGAIVVAPVPCRLDAVLERAAGEVATAAGERGCVLRVLPTAAVCLADPTWAREAIGNLMDNAVKYSSAGGVVVVGVEELEVFCRIDVTDAGVGIAEEETASIFRRFYRSPSTADDRPGLGIGLALTRQIVQLHGGFVRVRSAPGRGSTFSVYLPRAAPAGDSDAGVDA